MLLATTMVPSPAIAAGETFEVLLTQEDGTPVWDADDNPGNDSGPTNGVVRTNDNLKYTVEVRVENGTSTNTTVELTYPQGVEAIGIPPFCGAGSTLTPATLPPPVVPVTATSWTSLPQQTISCNVGTRNPGSTLSYPLTGRVRSEVPQGTVLDPVTAEVTSDDVTVPVVTNETNAQVSARPKFDISKNATSQIENAGYLGGGGLTSCPSDPAKKCFHYLASVIVSTGNGGKGVAPLASPIVLTDDLTPDTLYGTPNGYPVMTDPNWIAAGAGALQKYGAELISCPASSVYTAPGFGIGGSLTDVNAVRDSGTFTCTQPGGPGTPVNISIANADTTAYTLPSTASYPNGQALPAGVGYVVAGRIDFGIPYDAVLDLGVSSGAGISDLTWDNEFIDFNPTSVDGTPNDPTANPPFNDHRRVTSTIRTRGSWSKTFIGEPNNPGNTPPTQFRPGFAVWEGPTNTTTSHSGDGILLPGQVVISGINLFNQSTADQDVSFLICDNWDNNKLRLKPGNYTSSAVARMQMVPSGGDAVWFSGYRDDGPYRTTAAGVPVTLEVEYGTGAFGNTETCEDGDSPTGWQTDPNTVPGGLAAISKVRLAAAIPANVNTVGTYSTVSIALEALGTDPSTGAPNTVGTILPNFASGKRVFGTHTMDDLLIDPTAWAIGTYNPEDNTGTQGDRMNMGQAAVRLDKEVWDSVSGAWVTSVPGYTSNEEVDYRLLPTLTSGFPTQSLLPVSVEDCLPQYQSYVAGSASIAPTVVQLGSPVGAELSCPASQIYMRWDLGALPIGDAIPPITYTALISSLATNGTQTNNALVSSPGDPSGADTRSALAQIQIVAPTGVAVDKQALTPQSDINRPGEANPDPLQWLVQFRNLDFPGALSDVDVIDVLPADGIAGTSFNGTLEFVSAAITAGTGATIYYTKTPTASLVSDGNDATNGAAGSTVWCDLPAGGAVFSGAGAASDCPASAAEVTGLRIQRPGPFLPTDVLDFTVDLLPMDNAEGDIYVNQVAGRAAGLVQMVGPVAKPEVIVAAEIGDIVWRDLNGDGVQDPGEPGIDGVTVSLWGIDDDGNPVGTAGTPLTTVTAGGGMYLFDQLPAGTYNIQFDDSTLASDEYWTMPDAQFDDLADSDGDVTTGLVAGIELSINDNRLDIDQGVVKTGLALVKSVNSDDANVPTGPVVAGGSPTDPPVTFDYVITNTGYVALDPVTLSDDVLGPITCPATLLAGGDTMTCTVTDPALEGPYTNTGTVTGQPVYPNGEPVDEPIEATDPANYFGANPSMTLMKSVNGQDANTAPGPSITTGDAVLFTYEIVNTGNIDINDIELVDDVLGAITCPSATLVVGGSMNCAAAAVATAGQYMNVGTVSGQPIDPNGEPFGEPLKVDDPAHYFGTDASISIIKYVNGEDANEPSGETIGQDEQVTFDYVITNDGNLELVDVSLSDDILGPITCPATTLAPGETMTCSVADVAISGPYTNIGTVEAQPLDPSGQPLGGPLQQSDPANYFGGSPSLTLLKTVNGEDANEAPGPSITVGEPVTFDYLVTNTGNLEINDIVVTDDVLGAITCPASNLAPAESMTCSATGEAVGGQYMNIGSANGQPVGPDGTPFGQPLATDDPAHYFGFGPGISLVKSVNGEDANAEPGLAVTVGDQLVFTYLVTNTGTVDLDQVVVTDDVLGSVPCPRVELAVGESMECSITTAAGSGPITNIGTAEARTAGDVCPPGTDSEDGSCSTVTVVSDSDPATYTGNPAEIAFTGASTRYLVMVALLLIAAGVFFRRQQLLTSTGAY